MKTPRCVIRHLSVVIALSSLYKCREAVGVLRQPSEVSVGCCGGGATWGVYWGALLVFRKVDRQMTHWMSQAWLFW
jgi:hypothetical protein